MTWPISQLIVKRQSSITSLLISKLILHLIYDAAFDVLLQGVQHITHFDAFTDCF